MADLSAFAAQRFDVPLDYSRDPGSFGFDDPTEHPHGLLDVMIDYIVIIMDSLLYFTHRIGEPAFYHLTVIGPARREAAF